MNFVKERKLKQQGFTRIAGLDEAGRGAWAGPIVAAGIILDPTVRLNTRLGKTLLMVRDSKQLTPFKREQLFNFLVCNYSWSVGRAEVDELMSQGLSVANRLAILRAVEGLKNKPDYLLIDYWSDINTSIPNQGITKGDQLVLSIAAASIVAKVFRDRLMINYHQIMPAWRFDRHKGYGTKLHQQRLSRYGVSKIHRLSFKPIQRIMI